MLAASEGRLVTKGWLRGCKSKDRLHDHTESAAQVQLVVRKTLLDETEGRIMIALHPSQSFVCCPSTEQIAIRYTGYDRGETVGSEETGVAAQIASRREGKRLARGKG